RRVLEGEDMRKVIMDMIETVVQNTITAFTSASKFPEEWNISGMLIQLEQKCLPEGMLRLSEAELRQMEPEEIIEKVLEAVHQSYEQKERIITEAGYDMREIERIIVLHAVDRMWMDHIDAMDQLREGIGLRAYGQKDPIVEYRLEGFDMFEQMIKDIQEAAVRMIFNVDVSRIPVRSQVAQPTKAAVSSSGGIQDRKPEKTSVKVGRNEPCPCGSGKKYKDCCAK
ncbi:MAG TPA: SEC-C metal-binding domain-containing protein, partial [Clostridia bacterium]|nr:SEC-C metal-binding domain-containing protein [Clostridia bacterium]